MEAGLTIEARTPRLLHEFIACFFPARGTALSLINVETVHSIRINMSGVILDCCRVSRALFALRLCILVRLECGFRYETNFDCVL